MNTLLHIVHYLPYGGLEKLVYDLSTALNGRGYVVRVAALAQGGPMQAKLEQAGIPVHLFGKRPGKMDIILLRNLVKFIKRHDINIIHSHSGCLMYASLAGRMAGVKKILHTEHGKYFPETRGAIWEDRIFSRLITRFICVSDELEHYITTTTKVAKNKVETIINGIDTTAFYRYPAAARERLRVENGISPQSFVIGTVCRLIREKNVDFLINWIGRYGERYGDIVLVVVGDGPLSDEWRALAGSVGRGRVVFLGQRWDVADLLNMFDVFALVSTTEGTSLTILEAMATELPVIVSDVGGNSHIVHHGRTGYLFPVNDQQQFDTCLRTVVDDPVQAGKIGSRARAVVQREYSLDIVLKRYRDLYE